MPKNKDLKRLTRSRMRKTGESYTAARVQLLRKKTPENLAELAGTSDEAVRAKTGKTWQEWVRLLDAKGAASMPHRAIASYVHEEHGIPGWWAQTLTVGYERIRGLRDKGQRRGAREGSYEASKSRTFPVAVAKLYRAFSTSRTRKKWLPDVALAVRTATASKSMRITWPDATSVELYFTAKGPQKSQVAIQHRGLASQADAVSRKEYWADRLSALEALLNPSASASRRRSS